MTNPKNPILLFEIEHAGLAPGAGHWSLDDFVSELQAPDCRIFFVAGSREGFVLYRDVVGDIEIMNLAVRTKGAGHGRILLESFLLTMLGDEKHSERKVFLEVASTNKAARRLYEAVGFRETGVRRAYYRSGEDAVTYVREPKMETPS